MHLTPALLQAGVTRGVPARVLQVQSTGFADLDACLPDHGWPQGTLVELQAAGSGIGELQLLMPALARLGEDRGHLVWVAPPYRLSAPMLVAHRITLERVLIVHPKTHKEALWSVHEALSNASVGAVICWFPDIRHSEFRALARAAEKSGRWGFCFLPMATSPRIARLRLVLRSLSRGLRVDVEGPRARTPVVIADIHRQVAASCRNGSRGG